MVARRMMVGPQIPQFYAGRSVFITGATGFMGKVLIERLLSTCPDIGCLYLLMRRKKDVSPESRLLKLKQSELFDILRQKNPSQLDKLCVVPGDVSEPNLGMTDDAIAYLHEVSVVFHSAATLKFHEELKKAVDQNIRSVIQLMAVCDKLPNMEAFIHVSTAYSNADRTVVEEKIYTPTNELNQLLSFVDHVPAELMNDIVDRYIAPKPNTYTFTKAMAECAVEKHGCSNYPVSIFRPTIVVSSLKHPFPGWIDNLNGPSGIVVGAGKGLLHVFRCKSSAKADMLPVDIAIDTLLAVAWETAVDKSPDVRVYNCSSYENSCTWGRFEDNLRKYLLENPVGKVFWYPSGGCVESKYAHNVLEFLSQTLPLHLAEYTTRLLGIKTQLSLIVVNQKLQAMNDALAFFSLREWQFTTDRVKKLRARLTPEDAKIYNLDPNSIDWDEHHKNFVMGTRRYILKEKDNDLTKAKQHLRRMFYLHTALKFLTMAFFLRLILRNNFARAFLYGAITLLLSVFNTVFTRFNFTGEKRIDIFKDRL